MYVSSFPPEFRDLGGGARPRRGARVGDRLALWSLLLYLPLAGVAAAWRLLGMDLDPVPLAGKADLLWGALGAGIAAAVVLASMELSRRFEFAREMERAFRTILGRLSVPGAALIAFSSATGEEMFFRAAVQEALARLCLSAAWGLIFASLLFGIAHVPPGPESRALRAWGPFATILGFVLGGLYLASGSVVAPVVCHFGINFVNLRRIAGGAADDAISTMENPGSPPPPIAC